ncbi:hypothetical protein [Bacillus badius]|uniref:hypothetical protein n=1 Tax=Bacillus badius TaxID=1455 RepID=UPI000597CE48|nr:hypothetical protein [Bacillus badius]KIL72522.1 hypothetical protein SD78_4107 [Bacillus badius]
MEAKFLAWDWDGGEFKKIPSNNVVEAIYIAWNYEFDVFTAEDKKLIFSGQEDNEGNSAMLEPYGLRLIDHEEYRRLQNVETGEIYYPSWHKETQG